MAADALTRRGLGTSQGMGPLDVFKLYETLDVPDPITFVISPDWLDRGTLYPRQATLIKLIFLRLDLMTEYDHRVINEWMTSFAMTGDNGIQTDVLRRIEILKAQGYRWFREILLVMGRRGGKGHLSALAFAYVLWNYLAKGDPQGYYGVDRDKQLTALIFAGKKDQAKANLFGDLYNVITGAPCFSDYIANPQTESLTVYAPYDFARMRKAESRGVKVGRDKATFTIQPKESTLMAARGPASFLLGFDEQAHVVASGSNRDAGDVYKSATPSLDQFGKDAFIIAPSSPWERIGQFYTSYEHSLELDEEEVPLYPEMLMVQLTSWDPYEDWEIAHEIDLFPPGFKGDLGEYEEEVLPRLKPLKGAIQVYDDGMRKLENANPDSFAVERRSKFANVIDAYLNEQRILDIFKPWAGRLPQYGSPVLEMQTRGKLIWTYASHADPSSVNCNFGLAVAHTEPDENGILHCVFDLIHHWDPADFPDHTIDYDVIGDYIVDNVANAFYPDIITMDQFNSVATLQKINKAIMAKPGPKRVVAFEKTATKQLNWSRAETFKAAINMGLVHAPQYDLAEVELKFLQDKGNQVVDHPTVGPVQTKDVADCMFQVVHHFLGKQVQLMFEELGKTRIGGGLAGGTLGIPKSPEHQNVHEQLGGFGAQRRAIQQGMGPARGNRYGRGR